MMRILAKFILTAALGTGLLAGPLVAEDLIPAKRFIMVQDLDLPGGDIGSQFDTTLESCQRACIATKACTAITFNARVGACFLKADPGTPAPYVGAYSAWVVTALPALQARAELRAKELDFHNESDLVAARVQAEGLATLHITGEAAAGDLRQQARFAETSGDLLTAAAAVGTAINLTDDPQDWAEYARLLLMAAPQNSNTRNALYTRSVLAATNGYLRVDNPGMQHNLLVDMAHGLEGLGQGRDMVRALQLAQAVQARDDTQQMLETAIGKYGFRIIEHDVQSDSARPRLCASFSDDLLENGVNYSDFVQVEASGLTTERVGDRQLCVEGLVHGQRYALTFRAGILAKDGQATVKPVTITAYVRDRSPAVRFSGRAFVLPKVAGAAIPVETVNAAKLELTLYAISDRNILRAVQGDYFGEPMPYYREDGFADGVGDAIWKGAAEVAVEVNRDVTSRLPMEVALAGRPAGIYALKATIPGKAEDEVGPAWQWFVVSDLGITSFSGVDGLHVVVRSLGTAAAMPGVTVELLSRANVVLGTAPVDAQGYAVFPAALAQGKAGAAPAMIIARAGDADMAFLPLTDPEFDLSDRGVEGREAAPPIDVFLATDRGAYRAGETVYATALARDGVADAIPGLPLTAVVKRPDGVEYSRAVAPDAGAGGHVFTLPIAATVPRGQWRVELFADLEAKPLRAATFLVEDFLPERIDFTLSLPDAPLRLDDAPDLTVEARYLFGAPGADLGIEGEVVLRAAIGLAKFPGYVFGRADEPFSTRVEGFSDQVTDDTGKAVFTLPIPSVDDPARPLEILAAVRVREGSGRPVERRLIKALQPLAPMIGIKPMFDGVVGEGTDARFELIAVGPNETPVPMAVEWELTRIETRYQWYQEYGNWNWEPVTSRTRVADGRADLGTDAVQVSGAVTWGEYELAVSQAGGGAASSTNFYAGWYAPADVSSTPDTLELSLDKPAYVPGQTAQLRLVPRTAGTALISVLSNRLVSMKVVEVVAGENVIPLEVTADWGAGVYVTASVLRPMDVAAGRNPARALGLAHAAIDPGTRALPVAVEVPAEVTPRGPMNVAVKVDAAAGDTAYVTVAAVDLGILNLTGFKSPDPKGHYFGQRKLGVGIRDIYGRLIDGLNGAEGIVRSGGDGSAAPGLQAPPPTEELVAYFTGPVTVGADGYARVSFDLPSFNGTVRVMAVAWSRRGVGQAEADVLVRDPVVITASVPRFMAPGDESRVLLEIVHAAGPAGRMGLDMTASGATLGAVPSGFDLAEKGKAVFEVPLTAGAAGVQTIDVALTTPDGKQLTKRLQMPVQVGDPEVSRTSRLELAAGSDFTLDQSVFTDFAPGSGLATMAIGPIARLDAPGLLAALDRYPYGCTEQITSRALPLIYFDQVAQAMRLKGAENVSQRIEEAIAEVLTNQTSEGSFGLWSASSGDFWLDAYVTDFLSRARANGHKVPDLAFRSALDNLRSQVNYQPDFDSGGEALAYALMVLAREGAAAIGDLRYYADVKAGAFATALAQAQLGAALASYGDQPRADAMFRTAADRAMALSTAETRQLFRADYGTNRRDLAAVLTLAVESGSQAIDRDAMAQRVGLAGRMSTQEATWTLLAANALIDRAGADGITIDGAAVDGPLVRVLEVGAGAPVVVSNGSVKPATLTLTTYGVPAVPEPAGGNGYAIARDYYTLDGVAVDLSGGVKTGTRLVTVLTVTPFGEGQARLMVADPLPAGFEIDNPNLLRGGQISALDWLDLEQDVARTEFRQDRFLTAIDRFGTDAFRLAYIVRAVSPGAFHHPAASVEDMYRPDFRAHSDAGRVVISK